MKSAALLNTTIFVRFLIALYRDGWKCQVQDSKSTPAGPGRQSGGESRYPSRQASLTGNGLRRIDLPGLVMVQLVMPLGVMTMGAHTVCRERPRCEHPEYHCRQKKSHELAHTDLSLFCSERCDSVFDAAVRRPHDTRGEREGKHPAPGIVSQNCCGGTRDAILGSMTHNTVSDQRRLPDAEVCRTRYVVPSAVSQCLVENPDACQYAIRFGSGVICRHPARRSFEKPDPL